MFHKLDNPVACPGAYDLTLYCDHENDEHPYNFKFQIIGQSERECRAAARARGWKIHADNTATCPRCIQRKKDKR